MVRPSLSYRQNLFSSLKRREPHSSLQSTLSRRQSSRAWRCRGVGGSLARGTRDRSPAASKQFRMVLGAISGLICVRISSLDAVQAATAARTMRWSWRASVLCSRPVPDLRVWECSTDYRWNQRHTMIHCTQHVQHTSICPSSFPQAYNATPFKWLKLFNKSTYLSPGHGCTLEWT